MSEDNEFLDSREMAGSNPFEDYHQHMSVHELQQASYPLSLNKKCVEGHNTPLSRFSEATHQSEVKAEVNEIKNHWVCQQAVQKLYSTEKIKGIQQDGDLKAKVRSLTETVANLECYTSILQKRNQQIVVALEKQKLKSTHLEQALNILRKEDQNLDKKINEQLELFTRLKLEYEDQQDLNQSLANKLEQSQVQNNYLKELILLANNNYENLERKYLTLVERNKKNEEENLIKQKELSCNMQQMKNLLANFISNPNCSPTFHNLSFGEQDENNTKRIPLICINKNQKKQAEDIYRKMFIKTLKTKK